MDTTIDLELVAWVRRIARDGGARRLREATGISVSEVARQIDASPAAVSRWERGERIPRGEHADRWARLLRKLSAT